MRRSVKLGLGTAAIATAAISLAGSPAQAFTFETIGGDASGGSRYSDQGSSTNTLAPGTHLFGLGGPTVQFGAQQGAQSPFMRTPGAAFGSAPSQPPPDPYNLANPNRY
jgi:ABC-type transporter Mla subunit MlaD